MQQRLARTDELVARLRVGRGGEPKRMAATQCAQIVRRETVVLCTHKARVQGRGPLCATIWRLDVLSEPLRAYQG